MAETCSTMARTARIVQQIPDSPYITYRICYISPVAECLQIQDRMLLKGLDPKTSVYCEDHMERCGNAFNTFSQ